MTTVADPEIGQALALATERVWRAGVRGIPTLRCGARLFDGDDRLEDAAGHLTAQTAAKHRAQ